jgi:hypothetical protein
MLTAIRTLALGTLLILTACAPYRGSAGLPEPSPSKLLHVAVEDGVKAIDLDHGAVRFTLPPGIASPDGGRFFAASSVEEGTRLEVHSGADGTVLASQVVPGSQVPAVASRRGRLVALTPPSAQAGHWLAAGRDQTDLVVADVERGSHRTYPLAGNYAPEAFASADDRLFVVEYLPALAPERYRVRQLDLATGQVLPVGARDKTVTVEEEMRGRSRTQVLAPDGSRLYTLYVRDEDHLHVRDYPEAGGTGQPNSQVKAFVHVLSLTEGWAFCLDLPMPFGTGPAEAHALALSPDGQRLYVASATSGFSYAVADTATLQIVSVQRKNAPMTYLPGAPALLRAAGDGTLYLATGRELVALDRGRRGGYRRALAEPLLGMDLSADGSRLTAISASRLTVFDPATGEVRTELPLGDDAESHAHTTPAPPRLLTARQ